MTPLNGSPKLMATNAEEISTFLIDFQAWLLCFSGYRKVSIQIHPFISYNYLLLLSVHLYPFFDENYRDSAI
jgi:hypothetical protein